MAHTPQYTDTKKQLPQQITISTFHLRYLTILQLLEVPVVLNQSCIIFLGFYTSPLGSRELFLRDLLRAGGRCSLFSSTFAD